MRSSWVFCAVTILLASGALAAGPFEASVMIAPTYGSAEGDDEQFELGPSLALNYYWRERISAEVTVAAGQETVAEFHEGEQTPERVEVDSFSLSGAALYHFRNKTRWHPYAGAGLLANFADVPEDGEGEDRLAVLFEAGLRYLFTPAVALRLDAKVLGITLTGEEEFGEDTRFSAGISWRF